MIKAPSWEVTTQETPVVWLNAVSPVAFGLGVSWRKLCATASHPECRGSAHSHKTTNAHKTKYACFSVQLKKTPNQNLSTILLLFSCEIYTSSVLCFPLFFSLGWICQEEGGKRESEEVLEKARVELFSRLFGGLGWGFLVGFFWWFFLCLFVLEQNKTPHEYSYKLHFFSLLNWS